MEVIFANNTCSFHKLATKRLNTRYTHTKRKVCKLSLEKGTNK